ncbi:MAG: sigma-70 family RNA polymerase sigma factor [Bryobacterales bacterium]|nr:sigma-70 family RNA polymerase sigma factor [Bryobacterales bacterium]
MHEPLRQLVERIRTGDESALGELTPALYEELHRIAARHLRNERANHTLQPTALVNEAYLKLVGEADGREFTGKVHFLAVASRVMRQVLIDYARSRASLKRAAGLAQPDSRLEVASPEPPVGLHDLIELDAALGALAAEEADIAQLVEMRYFGGMTAEEIAEALGRSVHVVRHQLRFAQAWLKRRLAG